MILVDSNVWLALLLSEHALHASVAKWVEQVPAGGTLLFCRSTQQSLLRLLTTREVLRPYGNPPLSNREAWGIYRRLRADRRIGFAEEPSGLEECWRGLSNRATASPKLFMDAYLAAFAIRGGFQMATTDSTFRQYADLDLLLLR